MLNLHYFLPVFPVHLGTVCTCVLWTCLMFLFLKVEGRQVLRALRPRMLIETEICCSPFHPRAAFTRRLFYPCGYLYDIIWLICKDCESLFCVLFLPLNCLASQRSWHLLPLSASFTWCYHCYNVPGLHALVKAESKQGDHLLNIIDYRWRRR